LDGIDICISKGESLKDIFPDRYKIKKWRNDMVNAWISIVWNFTGSNIMIPKLLDSKTWGCCGYKTLNIAVSFECPFLSIHFSKYTLSFSKSPFASSVSESASREFICFSRRWWLKLAKIQPEAEIVIKGLMFVVCVVVVEMRARCEIIVGAVTPIR
jgi:hypothetical protein